MASDTWRVLGLEPARLRDLNEILEPQSATLSVTSFQSNGQAQARRLQTLEDWRAQDPVERIANTILLCAIRDGAHQITIDPQSQGIYVRFTTLGEVRDHIKLPSFALPPLTELFKVMAQIDVAEIGEQQGLLKLRVNDLEYALRVSIHPTPWGERVELRFASQP